VVTAYFLCSFIVRAFEHGGGREPVYGSMAGGLFSSHCFCNLYFPTEMYVCQGKGLSVRLYYSVSIGHSDARAIEHEQG
jgi:hypothetical protein